MTDWYRDVLGLGFCEHGLWQQTMLNFRVADLNSLIAQLRNADAEMAAQTRQMDGIDRFGWVTDPERNRIELWEPEAKS